MGTGNVKGRSLAVAESGGPDLKPARDLEGELSAHRKALADLMRSPALGDELVQFVHPRRGNLRRALHRRQDRRRRSQRARAADCNEVMQ